MTSPLNSKVQAQSLVDAVTERLETAIFKGELEPGSRLSEQALANSLGVSRGPLREAIRRLEGRRLVQRTPNVGVRVVDLSLKDFTEILQVQEALQGLASALAARNMDADEIKQLKKLMERHSSKNTKGRAKGKYHESDDVDFHTLIMKGSRNERLAQMLGEELYFLVRANRYKFTASPERIDAIWDEHAAIVDAIEKGDEAMAERMMREHIAHAMHAMQERIADKSSEAASKAGAPKRAARSKAKRSK